MVNIELVRAAIDLLIWTVELAKTLAPLNRTEAMELVRPLVNETIELLKIGIHSLIAPLL